ncbi:MAG: hypothetical protein IJ001_00330 [Oscillospiraceae bacterium]|nr:hypothetical protein [Oscillospiraceae bacterium]
MAEFRIRIAGRVAAVSSLFESTRDYCRAYLTEDSPDFSVAVTREDLAFEQEDAIREAREEGFRVRIFPEPFLDRAAIQRKVAENLFRWDTLLLHGSTVAVDGEGYLFAAKSGTGKSTHTRLWREAFGERAVMVNDDKPFLRITGEEILVCGAPWSGKHGLDTNISVPLKGICLLERGPENRIRPAEPGEIVPILRHQGCCPRGPACRSRYGELIDILAARTPLWRMECNKDIRAAWVAYEAMSR